MKSSRLKRIPVLNVEVISDKTIALSGFRLGKVYKLGKRFSRGQMWIIHGGIDSSNHWVLFD